MLANRTVRSVLVLSALALSGCAWAFKKPAAEATQGAVKGAEESLQPQVVADLTRNLTAGVLRGLSQVALDPVEMQRMQTVVQALVRAVVAGATDGAGTSASSLVAQARGSVGELSHQVGFELARGLVDGLSSRISPMIVANGGAAGLGEELGRGLVRGASEELARQAQASGGPLLPGPFGQAIAANAERVSAAAVRGGASGLVDTMPCPSGDRPRCLQDSLRALSRASAAGASDAVAKETSIWPYALSFALGALLALFAVGAFRAATRRRAQLHRPLPPGTPQPA